MELHRLLSEQGDFTVCSFAQLEQQPAPDIIINATSAGVKGETTSFPASLFSAGSFCYDLSYSTAETAFQRLALDAGAGRAVQGWGMLVEQAAESFRIWRGVRPDTAEILERLGKISSGGNVNAG